MHDNRPRGTRDMHADAIWSARPAGQPVRLWRVLGLALVLAFAAAPHAPAFSVSDTLPVPVEKPSRDKEGNIVVETTLENALEALETNDTATVENILSQLQPGSLDHLTLAWCLATKPWSSQSLDQLSAFDSLLKDWPGRSAIRANIERAIYRENPDPRGVVESFAENPPETMAGRIALARALNRIGETARAGEMAREIWADIDLDQGTATVFEAEFGTFLDRQSHLLRMKKLLYRDRVSAALAPSRKAGAESLYQAWVQTIRAPARAMSAIGMIDDTFADDPAVTYLKVRRLRQLNQSEEASLLLQTMPDDDNALVDPEEWWVEQRIISRDLYEKGKPVEAYRVAAAHRALDPRIAAEAEFHAGWYALRGLDDPLLARTHFRSLLELAPSASEKARAFYWLSRTHLAGSSGPDTKKAQSLLARAALYPTSYYGQLALAALNRPMPDLVKPSLTAQSRDIIQNDPVYQAIARLRELGATAQADRLTRELARQTTDTSLLTVLAEDAAARADHPLALQIGRIGLSRGLDVAALAFPLGALPADAEISGAGLALTYAVARQESAFNVAAVSPANARGLLQLLPGTARGVASRHELAYSPQRLTTDAAYNATLGAHYLSEQIGGFDGSYVLTFIAYNAGPKRVREWTDRFGDPRGKPLDAVVDWVEQIPFPETRDYVQRVLENYQVYKTRLGQTANIAEDLRFGRVE